MNNILTNKTIISLKKKLVSWTMIEGVSFFINVQREILLPFHVNYNHNLVSMKFSKLTYVYLQIYYYSSRSVCFALYNWFALPHITKYVASVIFLGCFVMFLVIIKNRVQSLLKHYTFLYEICVD